MNLNDPIEKLYKIGPAYAKRLHSLDIKVIKDLLFYFPFRYDDFSEFTPIGDLEVGSMATVQGKIISVKNIQTYKKRMHITEVLIEDESGLIKAVWFNQPFLKDNFLEFLADIY